MRRHDDCPVVLDIVVDIDVWRRVCEVLTSIASSAERVMTLIALHSESGGISPRSDSIRFRLKCTARFVHVRMIMADIDDLDLFTAS